jgi:hypothetical protein
MEMIPSEFLGMTILLAKWMKQEIDKGYYRQIKPGVFELTEKGVKAMGWEDFMAWWCGQYPDEDHKYRIKLSKIVEEMEEWLSRHSIDSVVKYGELIQCVIDVGFVMEIGPGVFNWTQEGKEFFDINPMPKSPLWEFFDMFEEILRDHSPEDIERLVLELRNLGKKKVLGKNYDEEGVK